MNGNRKSKTTNAAMPSASDRLCDGDLHKLLAAAPADIRALIRFGILTGLRSRELTELRKDDCVLDGVVQPYVQVEHHKTSRSARPPESHTAPLCPDAHEILKTQAGIHPASEFVFLDSRGAPYTQRSFKNRLARLCKTVGLSRACTPSCLRRTYACIMLDTGVEITTLSRLMGHTTTRTMERYVSNIPIRNRHRKGVSGL